MFDFILPNLVALVVQTWLNSSSSSSLKWEIIIRMCECLSSSSVALNWEPEKLSSPNSDETKRPKAYCLSRNSSDSCVRHLISAFSVLSVRNSVVRLCRNHAILERRKKLNSFYGFLDFDPFHYFRCVDIIAFYVVRFVADAATKGCFFLLIHFFFIIQFVQLSSIFSFLSVARKIIEIDELTFLRSWDRTKSEWNRRAFVVRSAWIETEQKKEKINQTTVRPVWFVLLCVIELDQRPICW